MRLLTLAKDADAWIGHSADSDAVIAGIFVGMQDKVVSLGRGHAERADLERRHGEAVWGDDDEFVAIDGKLRRTVIARRLNDAETIPATRRHVESGDGSAWEVDHVELLSILIS